jgi:UDP-galactose transporter B1
VKFSACSAIGQSFIFYTVATFDPLVCSTVTTTRKIFSVLLSIFTKGHNLSSSGWAGISLAIGGILSEMQAKYSASRARHYKSKVSM